MLLWQIRCSIVVSISACHAEDPGSIPGRGGLFLLTLCGGWSQGHRQGLSPDSRQAPAFFCTRCLHDLRDLSCRWRPYRVECTGSLPTSEVKRRRARLVLGWGTAWEDLRVLTAFLQRRKDSIASTFLHCARGPGLCNPQLGRAADSETFYLVGVILKA